MHDRDDTSPTRAGSQRPASATDTAMPIIDARALFGAAREIGIEHDGALYRLKITRQGKLILNK